MESNHTKGEFDTLTQTIGALRAAVAELQVQNELLEYRLQKSERQCRDLEREVQEHRAYWGTSRIPDFSQSVYDPRSGWGKGKDE